jgi:hypothetical protein
MSARPPYLTMSAGLQPIIWAGMMASVSTMSPKRWTMPRTRDGRWDQTAGSARAGSSSPAGAVGSRRTGLGSMTVKLAGWGSPGAESEWQRVALGIHSRRVSKRAWSTFARKGEGSVTFMSKAEAATTTAEARLAMLPLPIRFLKLRFWEESQTSPSPATSAAMPRQKEQPGEPTTKPAFS